MERTLLGVNSSPNEGRLPGAFQLSFVVWFQVIQEGKGVGEDVVLTRASQRASTSRAAAQ